jgi:parallel beta-helix repeat protein
MKDVAVAFMMTVILVSTLVVALDVRPAGANEVIYIRADGSIDPPTAPISTLNNVIYTFTSDISGSIWVERSNVVIDGNGFTLQGDGSGTGIGLFQLENVTVRDTHIKGFGEAIWLFSSNSAIYGNDITGNGDGISVGSSSNTIAENNITANSDYGIWLYSPASLNVISGNNITNSYTGIYLSSSSLNLISGNNVADNNDGINLLFSSSNNTISENDIATNSRHGIWFDDSSNCTITGNNVTTNLYGITISRSYSNTISGNIIEANSFDGILLSGSSSNFIYHNDLVNNGPQASAYGTNTWDDGYPSGGNYWGDYTGADVYSGPEQNEPGSDDIGDTPYLISSSTDRDRYPLMSSSVHRILHNVTITETGLPTGVKWSVTLNGRTRGSTSNSITFSELDGTYQYEVSMLPGFDESTTSGTIIVEGANVQKAITFSLNPSEVTTTWNAYLDTYAVTNPITLWSLKGNCYGMASTALMYYMRNKRGDTSYPCFPSQSPPATSTSGLNLDVKWDLGNTPYFEKLNNASLAVTFNQVYLKSHIGAPTQLDTSTLIAWENQQFINLLANLTAGNPVALAIMDRDIPWDWGHSVVAIAARPQLVNNIPTGAVDVFLYDPNFPTETRTATYSAVAGSFSYGAYDLFYVANPRDMLPNFPVTPSNYPASISDWAIGDWLANSVPGYTLFIADKPITVTALSDGHYCRFTGGDSSTFECGIPGSSGIKEGNVQVIAIPGSVAYSVKDPGSSQSTIMITHVKNQSGQLVGYGYFLNATTMLGSLNYTITPSNSSLLVSAGNNALTVSVTFFSSSLLGRSFSQVLYVQVDSMQSVNITRPVVAITMNVASSRNIIGQGYEIGLSVTVENLGSYAGLFNVAICADEVIIGRFADVTLPDSSTTILSFEWNTTGFARGDHTINAYAELDLGGILHGFNATGCLVEVTIPGDADGDRDVDIFDIVRMAGVYGVNLPDSRYNPNCDVDNDGDIDIFDIVILAGNYGKSW